MVDVRPQQLLHLLAPDQGGIGGRDALAVGEHFHLVGVQVVPPVPGQVARLKAHAQQEQGLRVGVEHLLQARRGLAEIEMGGIAGDRTAPFAAHGVDRVDVDAVLGEGTDALLGGGETGREDSAKEMNIGEDGLVVKEEAWVCRCEGGFGLS